MSKRLVDLDPRWVGRFHVDDIDRHGLGISFDCPVHGPPCRIVAPFDPPLDGKPPSVAKGVPWTRTGDTFETLTLTPSIRVRTGRWNEAKGATELVEHWHGYVTDGNVRTV